MPTDGIEGFSSPVDEFSRPKRFVERRRSLKLIEIESRFLKDSDAVRLIVNVRKIVGSHTRREFLISDRMMVCLDRADSTGRKLQFSLVEIERPRKTKRGKR